MSIEAFVAAVDYHSGQTHVRLRHAPVAAHEDQLAPDLVVDVVPLLQHLRDIVLRAVGRERKQGRRLDSLIVKVMATDTIHRQRNRSKTIGGRTWPPLPPPPRYNPRPWW